MSDDRLNYESAESVWRRWEPRHLHEETVRRTLLFGELFDEATDSVLVITDTDAFFRDRRPDGERKRFVVVSWQDDEFRVVEGGRTLHTEPLPVMDDAGELLAQVYGDQYRWVDGTER